MLKAVVFDLDDTLFPESEYVKSGFFAVAVQAKREYGIDCGETELNELYSIDASNVFDRFVSSHGLDEYATKNFLETYRRHLPNIWLKATVKNVLSELRKEGYKLGIITDGRPIGQANKIKALGLESMVDEIIITDELGGAEYRKPNPAAFEIMCSRLEVRPNETMYVGDNPRKDFAIKKFLPIVTARLINDGLYKDKTYLYGIKPDYIIDRFSEILECLND